MKIVVIARTRNEQRNISRFCRSYHWADSIILADGGSTDQTVPLASQFSNVHIRRFTKRVSKDGGITWRNPHGQHINYMIYEAEKLGADWIIFDDVDCIPTRWMENECRRWLENTDKDYAQVNRIYAYGKDKYFKQITIPTKKWATSTSLYAWRASTKLRAEEGNPWVHELLLPVGARILHFPPPLCIIHDYYPDDEIRKAKVKFYRDSGEQRECKDPLTYAGDIIDMEYWMKL